MEDWKNYTPLQRILYKELYKKSFYEFVKAFWNTCCPDKFIDGKLMKCYCEMFQYMVKDWIGYEELSIDVPKSSVDIDVIDIRQNKRNLCLCVPPRHTKSMIFNALGPTWLWVSYPIKAVSISHTGGLAMEMNSRRYAVINSEKFKFFFPDIKLITNKKDSLQDNRGGELYSQNREAMTGYGGDIIINDDITNAETARRDQAEMLAAWSYFQNTMPSRINNPNKGVIFNIQQRLAPNDIAGHILNDSRLRSTYVFITLPAIFEKETYVICPISGDIIHFDKDECLWPERFGDYTALRYQVGESIFQTQYLQKPIASDKTILKENIICEKDLIDTPGIENADMIYGSHDFPVKDKETSDYLGSILSYRCGANLYIVDCLEKRMAFVQSINYVLSLDSLYPGSIQIIEDKANGSPILQQLRNDVPGMQAFQPGTQSKIQRLESASIYFNSGNVILVKTVFNKLTNTWELSDSMKNLKQRLLNFPFVEHDDIVDAVSMNVLFVFMDRAYMVYGRSFNDKNIIDINNIDHIDYSNIFFNREGDVWRVAEIGIKYGIESKIYVKRETYFKASIDDALTKLKEFSPKKSLFIDCSMSDGLNGAYAKSISIERYIINDFDKSVTNLNLAFSKNIILIDKYCSLVKADIENFKFSKSKDQNVKYITEKDGFVACLRTAMEYYGI